MTTIIRTESKALLTALLCSLLAACGGGGGGGGGSTGSNTAGSTSTSTATSTASNASSTAAVAYTPPMAKMPTPAPLAAGEVAPSEADAVRFLTQASFGPTTASLAEIRGSGFRNWLVAHMLASGDNFSTTYSDAVHTAALKSFCTQYTDFPTDYAKTNCWQEYYSAEPLSRDFYRNSLYGVDQLRQRVALALGQIFVVSSSEVEGTYGLRDYQQMLLDKSFGNVRDLLLSISKSPVMGNYLNLVNNSKTDPNENFARELMQLFTIGQCALNADGSLKGGTCQATYDNNQVRDLAFTLTGWTYPAGGKSPYGNSGWMNPTYLRGEMLAVAAQHDQTARTLVGGVAVPASRTPVQGMNTAIDALFNHANIAPFISKQLIQHLVTSNPSPAYVGRVSAAFASGSAHGMGNGQRGDMKAIIAAILLDDEARGDNKNSIASYGRLREPAQFIAGMLRALSSQSDGSNFYYWWGEELGQAVFNANSVFNFYPPDYPLPGTTLVGPAFAIENPNSTLARINLGNQFLFSGGLGPVTGQPGGIGSHADTSVWQAQADDSATLVNRLEALLVTGGLPSDIKSGIVSAVAAWTPQNNASNWRRDRVATAFYLILACPEYQVQR